MDSLFWLGYPGLFVASFLAATILPFSSEAILSAMLIAGYDLVDCLLIATAGNWLGGLTNYWIGYFVKWEWLEKYFRVSEASVYKQKHRVDKYKSFLAFFTFVPFVGDLLAIALGVFRTPFIPVALYMLIGKAARYVVWGSLTIFGKNAFAFATTADSSYFDFLFT
jgi:membrane protein YqaA with SNARE-associated domain